MVSRRLLCVSDNADFGRCTKARASRMNPVCNSRSSSHISMVGSEGSEFIIALQSYVQLHPGFYDELNNKYRLGLTYIRISFLDMTFCQTLCVELLLLCNVVRNKFVIPNARDVETVRRV